MRLENRNHIMYCLNIHPGECLNDILMAIENYTLKVKNRICPDTDFGLGLRLSHTAAYELLTNLEDFKTFLEQHKLYVVTINGFSFGTFHGVRVKENVYLPDWSSPARVHYTCDLIKILTGILPEGETGTISTVPCHYGKDEKPSVVSHLFTVVRFLKETESKTGKHIILSLEPEPDCYLDSLNSTIEFFEKIFKEDESAGRYLGVCLDCCHVTVEFESPLCWLRKLTQSGIQVTKVQISSAIRAIAPHNPQQMFRPFNEGSYLHQTRVFTEYGILRYKDLSDALTYIPCGEWRVHFHVPPAWACNKISSTACLIEDNFFKQIERTGKRHVEVETYSYGVLPGAKLPLIDSITSEMEWLRERFDRVTGNNHKGHKG